MKREMRGFGERERERELGGGGKDTDGFYNNDKKFDPPPK